MSLTKLRSIFKVLKGSCLRQPSADEFQFHRFGPQPACRHFHTFDETLPAVVTASKPWREGDAVVRAAVVGRKAAAG